MLDIQLVIVLTLILSIPVYVYYAEKKTQWVKGSYRAKGYYRRRKGRHRPVKK